MPSRPAGPVVPRAWLLVAVVCALDFAGVSGLLGRQLRVLRAAYTELRERQTAQALPRVGDYVPAFWLPAVTGHHVAQAGAASLRPDSVLVGAPMPGRAAVLVAIAHDCPVCTATMDTLVALAARRDARVDWHWLALSPGDSITGYARRFGVREPVALLEDVRTTRLFGIRGTPVYAVIDARGRIRYVAAGPLSRAATRDSLLAMAREAAQDTLLAPRVDSPRAFPATPEVPP